MGRLGRVLRRLGRVLERLGLILERLEHVLERLGATGTRLSASRARLERNYVTRPQARSQVPSSSGSQEQTIIKEKKDFLQKKLTER